MTLLKGQPIANWGSTYFNVNGELRVNNRNIGNLVGLGVSDVDLNDMTTTGIYYCGTGLTNCPVSGYMYLLVMSTGGTDLVQIGLAVSQNELYIRTRAGSNGSVSWTNWKKIAVIT